MQEKQSLVLVVFKTYIKTVYFNLTSVKLLKKLRNN